MSQRTGAAVDIDLAVGNIQRAHGHQADHGKGFVDLEQIDRSQIPAGLAHQAFDGAHRRRREQPRLIGKRGVAVDDRQGLEATFLRLAATFATVWVWLMILVTHVAMRRSMTREQVAALKFPVPFWPYAPIAAIVFMVFIFGVLGYFPETQAALMVGAVWIVLLIVAYLLWVKPTAGRALEVASKVS